MKVNSNYSLVEAAATLLFFLVSMVSRAARNVEAWTFFVPGVMLLLLAVALLIALIERRAYQPVLGQLLSIDRETARSGRNYSWAFRVKVLYVYAIDGKAYESRRVNLRPWSFRSFCGNRELVESMRSFKSSNKTITVYVNESDPSKSVLTLDIDQAVVSGFVFLGVLLIVVPHVLPLW